MPHEGRPRRLRAWYGLPGEIVVEGKYWHLVKVGPIPLPHPPLVNRVIRRGLPRAARLQLSYWHELGHLQTLPLALAHALWMWRRRRGRRHDSFVLRSLRFATGLIAHEAAWELAAEAFTMVRAGTTYRQLHRRHPSPWLPAFWVGMAALAVLGTALVSGEGGSQG